MDRDRFPWPHYMWFAVAIMRGIIWLCKHGYAAIVRAIRSLHHA